MKENKLLKIKIYVLISAHGNSIRALCKFLFKLNEKKYQNLKYQLEIPLIIKLIN